jgi:hypothetical protein
MKGALSHNATAVGDVGSARPAFRFEKSLHSALISTTPEQRRRSHVPAT